MKRCPKCNNTLFHADDQFFYRDGTPLVEDIPHDCGRTINLAIDKFCPRCGKGATAGIDGAMRIVADILKLALCILALICIIAINLLWML